MGTQEAAEVVSEVGVAFWYGFAFGDLIAYIPLLAIGLIGYWLVLPLITLWGAWGLWRLTR